MTDVTWPFNETAERRFWAKVDQRGPDDCWPWTAAKSIGGYGWFGPGRGSNPAHASRCAWALVNRRWPPPDEFVCHTCDNPPCCNPNHLYLGSSADNVADMVARDRHGRGERNGYARLTERDVRAIRDLHAAGIGPYADLAVVFRVRRATIGKVVRRELWAHVP